MNDAVLTTEIESLIQGYMEGELNPLECARLRELLEASPGLVTPLLTNLRTDALIRQTVLHAASASLEVSPHRVNAQNESPASRRDGRFAVRLALAACLIVLVALAAMFFGPRSSPQSVTPATRLPETGSIQYEYWAGIPGAAVSDLTSHPNFQRPPTGSELLTQFEAPSGRGQNYGARVRGYLHPPASGNYLFWIASDDAGELWMSEDENPANKRRICFVDPWTPPREWTWQPSQQSPPISLQAGRSYYIEALHKQGETDDSLAVAWQAPGGVREIIPGRVLSPASQTNVVPR